jgi:hypothetical protein
MPPAAAGTATAGHGLEEAMDLSIVLQLLKKGIVLIPLTIMLAIFVIRKVLVYPDEKGASGTSNMSLIVGDQNFHHISSHPLTVAANNSSNANFSFTNVTFKEYFLMFHSEQNETTIT